jgi:putative membrane protein
MASMSTEGSKSLKPGTIDIPTSRGSGDGPMSPRSWRHRTATYNPPSRQHTAASLDAEDYFVRHLHLHLQPPTMAD